MDDLIGHMQKLTQDDWVQYMCHNTRNTLKCPPHGPTDALDDQPIAAKKIKQDGKPAKQFLAGSSTGSDACSMYLPFAEGCKTIIFLKELCKQKMVPQMHVVWNHICHSCMCLCLYRTSYLDRLGQQLQSFSWLTIQIFLYSFIQWSQNPNALYPGSAIFLHNKSQTQLTAKVAKIKPITSKWHPLAASEKTSFAIGPTVASVVASNYLTAQGQNFIQT